MVERYQAFSFEREITENASSKPWLISAIRSDEATVQLIVKFSSAKGIGKNFSKESELICAELAPKFDLKTPPFGLVSFSSAFIDSLSEANQHRLRQEKPGPYFCSVYLEGYTTFSPSMNVETYDLEKVIAFDFFLRNPDRRVQKPNLIISGADLRLIDHELCLGGVSGLTKKASEGDLSFLSNPYAVENHLFSPYLIQRVGSGEAFLFDEFQENLSRLNLEFLETYIKTSKSLSLDPEFLLNCLEYLNFGRNHSHKIKESLASGFALKPT